MVRPLWASATQTEPHSSAVRASAIQHIMSVMIRNWYGLKVFFLDLHWNFEHFLRRKEDFCKNISGVKLVCIVVIFNLSIPFFGKIAKIK